MMDNIAVRDARTGDINDIHNVLSKAFQPYRDYYTEEAYDVTVCSTREIKRRIDDNRFDVLVAVRKDQIVGTATLQLMEKGISYLSSMAAKPAVQGKGIGYCLLSTIEDRAREKRCSVVSLECCEFLKMAIGLYKRMGYKRTGRKRPYYGVEVFEMQKRL